MKRISMLIVLLAIMALVPFACSKGANENEIRQTAQNTQSSMNDAKITAEVKTKFAADDMVAARNIEVETQNGVVMLRGSVSSQQEADRAFQIASNVNDVRDVRSFLKAEGNAQYEENDNTSSDLKETAKKTGESIEETAKKTGDSIENAFEKAGETAKDAKITAAIKMKLAKDDVVKSSDIDVDTENGTVTLNGKVSSPAEEKRAVQIARATNDVREVHSNLTVQ